MKLLQKKSSLQLSGTDAFDLSPLSDIHYKTSTINRLPFEDNAFDIVTCNHTLEHIKNIDLAISELKRVAKK